MNRIDTWIPIDQCVHGHVYAIHSRNLWLGVYNALNGGFIGIRTKFGDRYLFTEYHWDEGAPYGTVKPFEFVEELPVGIEVEENTALFQYLEQLARSGSQSRGK